LNAESVVSRARRIARESGVRIFEEAIDEILLQKGLRRQIDFQYPHSMRKFKVEYHRTWKLLQKARADFVVMNYVKPFIGPNDIVLDVGADIGTWTLFLSEHCEVIAFEPDPISSSILARNIAANRIRNAHVEQACVSNMDGTLEMVSEKWGNSSSSIRGISQVNQNRSDECKLQQQLEFD
jgi:tRNA/tmRNA/rRNA uracil-C5-methylase (TrmA/RlmC/RlmD family)